MNKSYRFTFFFSLALFSLRLYALDISGNVGVEVKHTDNSLKSANNERSDLEQRALGVIKLDHTGDAVSAAADYSGEHTVFDRSTQSNETSVTGNALLTYKQIPKTLIWTLRNTRVNVVKDQALADVQANREDRSISSGSGQWLLRPSGVDTIGTTATYTDVRYQHTSQQNSHRTGGELSWNHLFSKIDSMAIRGSYQHVNFKAAANDYKYYLGTIGYSAALSRLSYSVAVGYNESKRDSGNVNGGYVNATANYNDGPTSVDLTLTRELTDTSLGNGNVDVSALNTYDSSSNNRVDIYERTAVDLAATFVSICDSCTVQAALLYENDDYQQVNNDSEESASNLSLSYRITRLVSIAGKVGYRHFNFTNGNPRADYDTYDAGISVNQRVFRALSVRYFVNYENRKSVLVTQNYEEFSGGLAVRYNFD